MAVSIQKTDNQQQWISATTRFNQEFSLRSFFVKRGVSHFIPSRTIIRRFGNEVREVEQPLIPNLVFLRTGWQEAFSIFRLCQNKMSYIRQKDRKILVIPDQQMEDFIRLISAAQEKITIRTDCYAVGNRVMVKSGPLAGIEGILTETDGKKEFVLRPVPLLSGSVRIPKSNLIPIREKEIPGRL